MTPSLYFSKDKVIKQQYNEPHADAVGKIESLSFTADLQTNQPILAINSDMDKLKVDYLNAEKNSASVCFLIILTVFLKLKVDGDFIFDHDMQFTVALKDPHAPFIAIEKASNESTDAGGILGMDCLSLNLLPCPTSVPKMKNVEIIFLIDRSGKHLKLYSSISFLP